MIERMAIEEENADEAYNGLVLGPNKPEPVAQAAPAAMAGPATVTSAHTALKQSTL